MGKLLNLKKNLKKPRAMHHKDRFSQLGIFEKRLSEIWDEAERRREKLSKDPVDRVANHGYLLLSC